MTTYDQPGFVADLPGVPEFNQRPMAPPGGPGMTPGGDEGGSLGSVTVSYTYGPATTKQVDVHDTARDSQYPEREPISGVALGGTGAGSGAVRGPSHPNSMVQDGVPR